MQFTRHARFAQTEGVCARDESHTRPRLGALAAALVEDTLAHAAATGQWPQTLTFAWSVCEAGGHDGAAPTHAKTRCAFPAHGGGAHGSSWAPRYTAALVAAALPCLERCGRDALLVRIQFTATQLEAMGQPGVEEERPQQAETLPAPHLPDELADDRVPLRASALLRALAEDARLGPAVQDVVRRRRQKLAASNDTTKAADA